MYISKRAGSIGASPTLSLNEKAKILRAEEKPVINLGVGEPINLAPPTAIAPAIARLETRLVKYTASSGIPDLKQAIIEYTLQNYGRTPTAKNVLVTVGAKQAIFNSLVTIVDPGDEVILLTPYWVSYPEMVKIPGGIPVSVSPPSGALHHQMGDILQAVNPKTRAIILNNPNNPTGVIQPKELVSALVQFCEENHIYLILDDIYHKLVFGDTPWLSSYQFTDRTIDESHLIVINGVSKSYGMTGFRIGWAVASQDLIGVMTNIQSQTTSGASVVTQEAALGALTGPQDCVDELLVFIKENRDAVLAEIRTIKDVSCIEPGGAFYCFPDFSAYQKDSMALSNFLLEKTYVAVVPGAAFGHDGHLRISFAGGRDEIIEGVRRIRWALDPDSPPEISIGDQKVVRDW